MTQPPQHHILDQRIMDFQSERTLSNVPPLPNTPPYTQLQIEILFSRFQLMILYQLMKKIWKNISEIIFLIFCNINFKHYVTGLYKNPDF